MARARHGWPSAGNPEPWPSLIPRPRRSGMAGFLCRGFSGMGCARVCACGGDESGSAWVTERALGSHAAGAAEVKRAQASAPPSSTRFGRCLRNPCCPRLRPGGWTYLFSSRVGGSRACCRDCADSSHLIRLSTRGFDCGLQIWGVCLGACVPTDSSCH